MPMTGPLLLIYALSSFCWAYVLVLGVAWVRAVARTNRRDHIGHFTDLMGAFVPGVALAVCMVILGAALKQAWMIVAIIVVFPGVVAFGLHLELGRISDTDPRHDWARIGVTLVLTFLMTRPVLP